MWIGTAPGKPPGNGTGGRFRWPCGAADRTRCALTTLVRLAKIRWRIEHDYRELKTGLGLDHFEGRSYLGWHRHVTLTALARAFCTQLRLDPKADAPA